MSQNQETVFSGVPSPRERCAGLGSTLRHWCFEILSKAPAGFLIFDLKVPWPKQPSTNHNCEKGQGDLERNLYHHTQRPQPNCYQEDDDTHDEQEEVKLDCDWHEFAFIADGFG